MRLSRNEKILAIPFAIMSVCGFLYTPAGLETRSVSTLRSVALIPFFFSTTVLDFASLILIFRKPRIASITAIAVAIMYILIAPGDQAELFFVGAPVPLGITINEIVALLASSQFSSSLQWSAKRTDPRETRIAAHLRSANREDRLGFQDQIESFSGRPI